MGLICERECLDESLCGFWGREWGLEGLWVLDGWMDGWIGAESEMGWWVFVLLG